MIWNIIIVYLGLLLTTIIHESLHLFMARIFNIEICEICIGWSSFAIRVTKKLYISPIPFGGFVVTYEEDLSAISRIQAGMFYMCSTIANIIVAVISLNIYFNLNVVVALFIGVYNIEIAIYNVLPFFSNDLTGYLETFKHKLEAC